MSDMLNDGFPYAETALAGRTALVSGASAGIGRATAQMLERAGARVIACARSADALEELVAELNGSGHEMLVLDLEDVEAVREAVLGLGMVEIVINNAGGPPGGPLISNKLEEFEGPFSRHLHASHTIA